MALMKSKRAIIAGPCALESRSQLRESVQTLKSLGINIVRACLWKPRTKPGWDGLGYMGVAILLEEVLSKGLIPATEIITSKHAECLAESLQAYDSSAELLLWLGSRNQNHIEFGEIAKILAAGPKGIYLMFKNQMWDDEAHWLGIAEHLLANGFPKERLLTCHRGFAPGKMPNPQNLRNLPDFDMAMRVKQKLGLPMLFDPSHTGGSPQNVMLVTNQALRYDFDGYIVEVHASPECAKTDSKQQLSTNQLVKIIEVVSQNQALVNGVEHKNGICHKNGPVDTPIDNYQRLSLRRMIRGHRSIKQPREIVEEWPFKLQNRI